MSRERILVVEDDQSLRWVMEKSLAKQGYRVLTAAGGEEGLALAGAGKADLVILDLLLPDLDGLSVLRGIRQAHPALPVMVITAQNVMRNAVEAMRHGAFDYLPKPFDLPVLLEFVARGLAQRDAAAPPAAGEEGTAAGSEGMVGRSRMMEELYKAMGKVAATDATVLILGESGTGKELVARAIHRFSDRAGKPFMAVNASAIPGELLESVLFGHEKGAFTGAVETRKGKFELAAGGTIFLDEIGDMPLALQAKLLRVLESREFERVGGQRSMTADVRVISATHRDLRQAVRDGAFREDLYFRLNVVALSVPPLRGRREDIPLLAEHFLRAFAREGGGAPRRLSPEALQRLCAHPWPGNVRELMNSLRRAAVMAGGPVIGTGDLTLEPVQQGEGPGKGEEQMSLEELLRVRLAPVAESWSHLEEGDLYDQLVAQMERPLFELMMKATGGNQLRAARILGINRNTLRERLRRYGLLAR
jgi:two-component system nitrogen regulation response regulator GlnG